MAEYKKPGTPVRIMNSLLGLLIRAGVSPQGAHLLTVAGRKSGKPMTTPVNPMTFEGAEYLVAPRGDTHWTRNLRAAKTARLDGQRKKRNIRLAAEIPDAEKPPLLIAYLERWGGVTKSHFGITWPNPSEAEVVRVCERTPMFRIEDAV
jgi:deazaflavin-dependent oxidoreductase (nitroreductase family)